MRNLSMATKTIGGGNLTVVRTSKTISKKLIATFLMISMLFCMSGVMASDVEDNGVPQGYIAIATKSENLGDGITLEKTLAVEQSRGRAGFSGQRSTMVIHRYFQNSIERLSVNAVAVFSSGEGRNVCYLDSKRYNYTIGPDKTWGVRDNIKETSENNTVDFFGNVYAKYTLEYDVICMPLIHKGWHTIWLKCTPNADLTTSGNQEWRNAIAQDDVVIYDNVAYQFN